MDPAEWPTWLKLIVGWGPLGIGWIWSERRRANADREHHATRDAHAKQLEKIEADHRAAMAAKDEVHRKQLDQVSDRMIRIVENQSRQAHRLADGVNERLRRGRNQDDDQGNDSGAAS